MDILASEWVLLIPLAFMAGLIDSAVGGGGLIQIPGFFSILPRMEAATLFGTNKLVSFSGTTLAAYQYSRQVSLRWRLLLVAGFSAFACAYVGAFFVKSLPIHWLRPTMLLLLLLMVLYTFFKKDLGYVHKPIVKNEIIKGLLLGCAIGLYDGFFGPGTGSLLAFAFVNLFGYDFLNASAHSKIINLSTNLGALALFVPTAHVLWLVAIVMGLSNMMGAFAGTHVVTKYGAPFIRKVFMVILSVTIVKFAYDTFILMKSANMF